jgi:hypothetical protein
MIFFCDKGGCAAIDESMDALARLEGFEPPAYGLEVRCSIQLSYRRAEQKCWQSHYHNEKGNVHKIQGAEDTGTMLCAIVESQYPHGIKAKSKCI